VSRDPDTVPGKWWVLVTVSLATFMTYLDGYHTGLFVTIGLMAAGVVVSYLTLRPRTAGAPVRSVGAGSAQPEHSAG
jgi:hypothetical protein